MKPRFRVHIISLWDERYLFGFKPLNMAAREWIFQNEHDLYKLDCTEFGRLYSSVFQKN